MKTETTLSRMEENNEFKITNIEDYVLIEVTAATEDGKNEVTMSFPWAHSIPFMNATVQDAIKKCGEVAKQSLTMHLENVAKHEARMTWAQKFMRFVRRDMSYFWKMGKLGVDKQNDIC